MPESGKAIEIRETVNTIILDALGTVFEGLEKKHTELKIKGKLKTIENTSMLRSVRILRTVLKT